METSKWTEQIDAVTLSFKREFGDLPSDKLNFKANSSFWSIAQCIDHLIIVNATFFPVIDRVCQGINYTPWTGKVGFMTRFFGNLILESVLPETRRKMKTRPLWEPSQSTIGNDILLLFERSQRELKLKIQACSMFLDQGTVISSPANRMIVYKLETGFDIIAAHEKRHLAQARVILRWLGAISAFGV